MTEERTCRYCNQTKPLSAFRPKRLKCRGCEAPSHREHVKRYKAKVRQEAKAHRLAQPASPTIGELVARLEALEKEVSDLRAENLLS